MSRDPNKPLGPIGRIVYVLLDDWWSIMSGGASIPFAAYGLLNSDSRPGQIFLSVAYVALLIMVFRLISRLTPKLSVACDRGIPGCIVSTSFTNGMNVNYFRLHVEALSSIPVEGCKGTIIKIAKNDEPRMAHENLVVTFAPGDGPDATSKTIYHGVAEALDLLVITERNEIIFPTPQFRRPTSIFPGSIFSEPGTYLMTVVVTGKGVPSVRATIEFEWAGDWILSDMRRIA